MPGCGTVTLESREISGWVAWVGLGASAPLSRTVSVQLCIIRVRPCSVIPIIHGLYGIGKYLEEL
jgi:hypothetical protein